MELLFELPETALKRFQGVVLSTARSEVNDPLKQSKGQRCTLAFVTWYACLGGGFKHFLNFHPYLGKISNLTNIFQMG